MRVLGMVEPGWRGGDYEGGFDDGLRLWDG